MPTTAAQEAYLVAVLRMTEAGDRVRVSGLAATLDVSTASASIMLGKLGAHGLVVVEDAGGVRLTADGEVLARNAVRRRGIVERYLVRVLHMPADRAGEEARRIEHYVSDAVQTRMAAALGDDMVRSA